MGVGYSGRPGFAQGLVELGRCVPLLTTPGTPAVMSKVKWFPKDVISGAGVASTSRGLVGDTHFAILPDVQPGHCFILTIIVQLVSTSRRLHGGLPESSPGRMLNTLPFG